MRGDRIGSGRQVEVSILLVSHNTRDMALACLDSIERETRSASCELIVVDNASQDGSAAAIGNHPITPRLFALRDNIGFARANNLAACHASGQYLLLLNPDTVILDRAIDRLLEFAQARPEALIWGGRTLFADGRLNASSCSARMTPWNQLCRATGLTGLWPSSMIFNGEVYGGWRRDHVREVDIVTGCFLMIPRALWDMLGGFDERYFMYGEEADLCLRARRHGARPQITPAATIVHHGGASERTRVGKMVKLLAAKASLIERHWSPALQPAGQLLLRSWPLTRWLANAAYAAVSGSPEASQAAVIWRQIWQVRSQWQNGYQASGPPTPSRPHLAASATGG